MFYGKNLFCRAFRDKQGTIIAPVCPSPPTAPDKIPGATPFSAPSCIPSADPPSPPQVQQLTVRMCACIRTDRTCTHRTICTIMVTTQALLSCSSSNSSMNSTQSTSTSTSSCSPSPRATWPAAFTVCFAERKKCPSAACHTLPHTVAPSRALGRNETRCGFLPHLAHCSTLIVHVCTVTSSSLSLQLPEPRGAKRLCGSDDQVQKELSLIHI